MLNCEIKKNYAGNINRKKAMEDLTKKDRNKTKLTNFYFKNKKTK